MDILIYKTRFNCEGKGKSPAHMCGN